MLHAETEFSCSLVYESAATSEIFFLLSRYHIFIDTTQKVQHLIFATHLGYYTSRIVYSWQSRLAENLLIYFKGLLLSLKGHLGKINNMCLVLYIEEGIFNWKKLVTWDFLVDTRDGSHKDNFCESLQILSAVESQT
jgi:hypothetical protein